MQFQRLDSSLDITIEGTFDRNILVRLAAKHGLIFPLYCFCKEFYSEQSELVEHLHRRSIANVMEVSKTNRQLTDISIKLSEGNIRHAVLKGHSACKQFYSNIPNNWRPSVDIDILIDPKSLPEAVSLLASESYICNYLDPKSIVDFVSVHPNWVAERDLGFSLEGRRDIDLHWRVAHHFSLPINTADLLARCEKVEINDRDVPTLPFNEHFVLLCIHGYLDHFYTLKHLADIFFAIHHPRFDEQALRDLASKYGVLRQVEESIQAAQFFFSGQVCSQELHEQPQFVIDTYNRFITHEGCPPRMHPNKSEWSGKDRRDYIRHQIKTRSINLSPFSPILHRFKYHLSMIGNSGCNRKHPVRLVLYSWFRRLFFG